MFGRLADATSRAVASPWAFLAAATLILVWAASGPIFRFSPTWQLVVNTGTTIITFLMVFLLAHAEAKNTWALHRKLDELVKATPADNDVVALEEK